MVMKIGNFLAVVLALGCFGFAPGANAQGKTESQKNLTAFPPASAGSTRFVIHLPSLEREEEAKVEIIAGRTTAVDCNTHWFGGGIAQNVVEGWGFDYFKVTVSDQMASTRMACPDASKRTAFVPVRGENFFVRYNSRVPLVIYAAEGVEIRYRIWKPSPETHSAEQG